MPAHLSYARRRRLLAKQPTDLVRVYSIQSFEARDAAAALGYWTGSVEHASKEWPEAYQWMHEQVVQRITLHSGDFPLWAYLSKPNMRRHKYDDDAVMVVADVPRWRMLISDYDLWHYPLNVWYITESEEEDERLEKAGVITAAANRVATPEIKKSWERIFDLERPKTDWLGGVRSFQACVDRIYPHEVVRVSPALGRLGRRGGNWF